MVKAVTAFEAEDGTVFKTKDAAELYDAEKTLRKLFDDNFNDAQYKLLASKRKQLAYDLMDNDPIPEAYYAKPN